MKNILERVRAILRGLFSPQARLGQKEWAKDQILELARLGGRLVL